MSKNIEEKDTKKLTDAEIKEILAYVDDDGCDDEYIAKEIIKSCININFDFNSLNVKDLERIILYLQELLVLKRSV